MFLGKCLGQKNLLLILMLIQSPRYVYLVIWVQGNFMEAGHSAEPTCITFYMIMRKNRLKYIVFGMMRIFMQPLSHTWSHLFHLMVLNKWGVKMAAESVSETIYSVNIGCSAGKNRQKPKQGSCSSTKHYPPELGLCCFLPTKYHLSIQFSQFFMNYFIVGVAFKEISSGGA